MGHYQSWWWHHAGCRWRRCRRHVCWTGPRQPNNGTFAGQVLVNQTTDLVKKLGSLASGDINVLQAVYEVQAGDHSFRALMQGGYDIPTNKARLEGVVLGGWRTGEKVHVEFKALGCDPVQTNAAGGTCFQGTITVAPGPEN